MKRFHFSIPAVFFSVVLAIVIFAVSGCKAPTVDYQITQFSTLRVMNFSPSGPNCSPTAPMDIYWYMGNTRPNQAAVYNLGYGGASVYSNLLQAGTYNVLVTPHLIPTTSDLKTSVTLVPNQKYSLIITGQFNSQLVQDGVPNPDPAMTYVRFMNLQSGTGALTVHVNDPVTGDIINPVADTFGMVSPYIALHTALDTSFAFFVTNSSNTIIARLSYQTFIGASCYTLVYAGDPCQTTATDLGDSTISGVDTLRLRAFDDNSTGNDLTNPIAPSFRFNVINDIIPASVPYDANSPSENSLGFVINGAGFREFNNYSMPAIPVYQGGGENAGVLVNGALEVNYQSMLIPNPMVVQGYVPSSGNQLFYANKLGEAALLAGSANNKPFTFLFYDTVPVPAKLAVLSTNLSSSSHYALIPVTDVSDPGQVTIEFIAGIVNYEKPNNVATANYSIFYVNDGTNVYPSSSATGIASGLSKIIQIPLQAGSSATFSVTDSIGNKGGTGGNRVIGNTSTFTAQAGGIYEVVSVGTKLNPQLLIMHVNSSNP